MIFQPAGDSALLITLGTQIDLALNRRVHALARRLSAHALAGVIECVPAYAAVLVQYDPLRLDYAEVLAWAQAQAALPLDAAQLTPRRVEIPVHYGGADGPDLLDVAEAHHLTPEEVVRIHTSADYPVYMLGFTPGFPYLGGMDAAIATPRLETPRARVAAGSVGIAGGQTGIYPLESPGGWRIIGRTPLALFDPLRDPPTLLAPGDWVRFVALLE